MSSTRSRPGQRSVLGDASGVVNSRPSRSRRKSFCVSDRSSSYGHQEETPSKLDRRALLEKWRKQNQREATESDDTLADKKRSRFDAPPLPPSASSSASNNSFVTADGISARERIRQRKRVNLGEEGSSATPSIASTKSTIEYYDDEEERGMSSRGISGRSPLLRKSLGGARRRSISLSSARRGRAAPLLSHEPEGKSTCGIPILSNIGSH